MVVELETCQQYQKQDFQILNSKQNSPWAGVEMLTKNIKAEKRDKIQCKGSQQIPMNKFIFNENSFSHIVYFLSVGHQVYLSTSYPSALYGVLYPDVLQCTFLLLYCMYYILVFIILHSALYYILVQSTAAGLNEYSSSKRPGTATGIALMMIDDDDVTDDDG